MLTNKFFFIAILLVFGAIVYFSIYENCSKLECFDMPGKGAWKEKEVFSSNDKSWRGIFEAEDYLIRAESRMLGSDESESEFTNSRLMQVQSLYDKARSPYPGEISDKIVCLEEFKPSEKKISSDNGVEITYYHEYLNERLVNGACQKDQIAYEGYAAIFFCRNTSMWYNLEMIQKANLEENSEEHFTSLFRKIKCQRPLAKIGKLLP